VRLNRKPLGAQFDTGAWNMRILYTSSDIRKAIAKLLTTSNGRRVVISAFVGSGAEIYLPKPQGIELVCWPKAGSTNPNAIRELIRRGVKVLFADQVHIKLYWTSDRGAVITSANLSSGAFGAGGQIEFGVFLEAGKVDIDRVLQQVKAQPVSDKALLKLEREHHDYIKRNPTETIRVTKVRDFNDWFESVAREPWKFTKWDVAPIRLSSTAKRLLKEEFGNTTCNSWMAANWGDYRDNDWILRLRETSKRLGAASWMFAHRVVLVPKSERKKLNDGFEAQVLQVGSLGRYEQPPFSLRGKRIQQAIRKAYRDISPSGVRPSLPFIRAIHKYYNER
jgi:hypothetical protein